MKNRLLFCVFLMLTASTASSQDTTEIKDQRPVVLPFWMAREIALDLAEKERLEEGEQLLVQELALYRSLVQGLEEVDRNQKLRLELTLKQNGLLHLKLATEQKKQPGKDWVGWVLRMVSVFSVGYLVGRVM